MKISHSAKEKYKVCPRMYELHYTERLRPDGTTSALVFGSACDAAFNELLKPTGKSPEDIFIDMWTNTDVNGSKVYVPTYNKMVYTKKDFDIDLLTEADYQEIDSRIGKGEVTWFDYSGLINRVNQLDDEELKFYNLLNWYSMKNKGYAFIKLYREEILPKLRVIDIQKEVVADNGHGDQLTGFIDLVAEVEGHGTVILDNKSSNGPYASNKVLQSDQLALYVHMESSTYGTNKGGFIVLDKIFSKTYHRKCTQCHTITTGKFETCPEKTGSKRCSGELVIDRVESKPKYQILINEIPESLENKVLDEIDDITNKIKMNHFPMNTSSCKMIFGKPCPYINYCKNGDTTGLVKLPERKK